MKDSLKNRIRAIHSVAAMDGEELCCRLLSLDKMSAKECRELLKFADEAMTKIYRLAHGWESSCCKGTGRDGMEEIIYSYYGTPKELQPLKEHPPT